MQFVPELRRGQRRNSDSTHAPVRGPFRQSLGCFNNLGLRIDIKFVEQTNTLLGDLLDGPAHPPSDLPIRLSGGKSPQ
jgi:hypothetical protein